MPEFVTQKEAAQRLHVHVNTIANMLNDGRLKAVEVGTEGGRTKPRRRVELVSLLHAEDLMFGPLSCSDCGRQENRVAAHLRMFFQGYYCVCGGPLR